MHNTEVDGYLTKVEIAEVEVAGLDLAAAINSQVRRDTLDDFESERVRREIDRVVGVIVPHVFQLVDGHGDGAGGLLQHLGLLFVRGIPDYTLFVLFTSLLVTGLHVNLLFFERHFADLFFFQPLFRDLLDSIYMVNCLNFDFTILNSFRQ